jgi:hypothetical protein
MKSSLQIAGRDLKNEFVIQGTTGGSGLELPTATATPGANRDACRSTLAAVRFERAG